MEGRAERMGAAGRRAREPEALPPRLTDRLPKVRSPGAFGAPRRRRVQLMRAAPSRSSFGLSWRHH
jgi:hypothetical protein